MHGERDRAGRAFLAAGASRLLHEDVGESHDGAFGSPDDLPGKHRDDRLRSAHRRSIRSEVSEGWGGGRQGAELDAGLDDSVDGRVGVDETEQRPRMNAVRKDEPADLQLVATLTTDGDLQLGDAKGLAEGSGFRAGRPIDRVAGPILGLAAPVSGLRPSEERLIPVDSQVASGDAERWIRRPREGQRSECCDRYDCPKAYRPRGDLTARPSISSVLNELEAKAALDAEVAAGDA